MTWGNVAIAAGTVISGVISSKSAKDSAESQSDATLQVAQEAEALNRERYAEAQGYLSPFISRELQASDRLMQELGFAPPQQFMGPIPASGPSQGGTPIAGGFDPLSSDPLSIGLMTEGGQPGVSFEGTYDASAWGIPTDGGVTPAATGPVGAGQQPTGYSYMDTPAYQASMGGYQSAMDAYDLVGQEQLAAVNQGAVNAGILYSGRRGQALGEVGASTQLAKAGAQLSQAGAETQFYNNYMNMLQGLANPASTTNIASLGVGQAATIGSQNIAAQTQASNYALQGTAASNAATADIIGGIGNIAGAYLNQPPPVTDPYGGFGGGASTNTGTNVYGGYV